MAKTIPQSAFVQNITYFLVCLISLCLIAGSFLLRMNFGEEVAGDQKVIEYSYQNESDDPMRRNHFRKIKIHIENVLSLTSLSSKNMRIAIYREGELGDKNLQTGKVFSIILEDMAKFKSVIFDYNRCVTENANTTDITVFLFKRYEADLALKVMIISMDRQTDKISVMGKEISASDIWTNDLTDSALLNKHQIPLDKGFLRLLTEERSHGN